MRTDSSFKLLMLLSLACAWSPPTCRAQSSESVVKPTLELHNDLVGDQDDLCFWLHPTDPTQSLVIASDKKANLLFVYDLNGVVNQTIEVKKPGNIDIRQGVQFGKQVLDIAVVNSRDGQPSIRVFAIDAASRQLNAIDEGGIPTRPNYGGCLAYDKNQKRLWFFCTSEDVGVTQYELNMSDTKTIRGQEVRQIELGKCEGAVADDESKSLFVAVEDEGVWLFGMMPEDSATGEKIISVGVDGLQADLEGVTLARMPDKTAALIVSSQGANRFCIYERSKPWRQISAFAISGATSSDGIDLIQNDRLPNFGQGIFGCHTDTQKHPILLTPWSSILEGQSMTKAKP